MYKIEFNDEMTIEGILSSFNNLSEVGIVACIDINGVIISWNDINLEEKVKQEYVNYKKRINHLLIPQKKKNIMIN